MHIDEIKEGYIYADESGSHFRKARQILEQKGVIRVRYWDSLGKNSCIPIDTFAAWASHVVATPGNRSSFPKKPRKPPYIWPGD